VSKAEVYPGKQQSLTLGVLHCIILYHVILKVVDLPFLNNLKNPSSNSEIGRSRIVLCHPYFLSSAEAPALRCPEFFSL